MKKVSKTSYQKYLKALKKAEFERAEEDKGVWRTFVHEFELIDGLPPIEKAEAWLRQVMIKGKSIFHPDDWISQFTVNEFADQEALIYFISRGGDFSNNIKDMAARLKEHKKKSEAFYKFLATWSDKELNFLGLQKKKSRPRKIDKDASYYEFMQRKSFSLANDDESYQVASMIRTIAWCEIGGYDEFWKEIANRLNEDVNRGGEIEHELASQTLFHICRSDFAIELMGDNLVKLLDIIEMPDFQLTIPWHRWNRDDLSRSAGIEGNSIYAYAASIAFASKRLPHHKPNQELVNQALKWLLENQEENGAWKISTILDEPSIMGTCIVVHALAINKPTGWKLAVSQACDWLLTKQDDFGFWYESPFPSVDPVYLTVLVMDTLELADGGSQLTFKIHEQALNSNEKGNSVFIPQAIHINGDLITGDKYDVGDNNRGTQNIGKFKNITNKAKDAESRTPIIVAIIGLTGVILAAIIGIIPNILQNKNNTSTPTMLPINSLVVPTSTFIPSLTSTFIVSTIVGETKTSPDTKEFQDGCIDSQVWIPYVGETHPKDLNGCWQLSDWGFSSQNDELQLFIDKNQSEQWHGIFALLPPNAYIQIQIRIEQLKTTQAGHAQIMLGIVDPTSINAQSPDRYLFYHVTSSDLVASISFGEWELRNAKFIQNYVYGINQQIDFSIQGTALEIYIDGTRVVGPTEIASPRQAFWIGYNLPADSTLSASINGLEITGK